MERLHRRSCLRSFSATILSAIGSRLFADDTAAHALATVHDDIRAALDDAPLAMRFTGRTREEFDDWQHEFRVVLNRLLGDSSPPTEWTQTIESRVEFDDHIRFELLLHAPPVPDLPVYLLLPKRASADAKAPGMVCLHGHGDHGHHPIVGRVDLPGVAKAIESARYDYGLQFVRRGYTVSAPCLIPFGNRVDRERYGGDDPCAVTLVRMQAIGKLPITENLRDARWAISLLQQQPEVDGKRIGCAGLSYGGRMTMLTAAIDKRVKVATVSGALNLIQERLTHRYSCGSQVIPGLLQYGDHPEIGGLIAPRPSVWEVGSRDGLIRSPYAEDFRARLRKIYAAAGASDQLHFDDFEGGHRWNGDVSYRATGDALGWTK